MPQAVWISIKGATQGEFKSDINRKGHEGKIDAHNYHDSLSVPYDSSGGAIAGRRVHSPISFSKDLDKTTPLLANAAFTNENLSTVKFEFVRPVATLGGTVGEKVFFTIELTNANIVAISRSISGESRVETILLIFEKIDITYVEGGVSASDDWSAGFANLT